MENRPAYDRGIDFLYGAPLLANTRHPGKISGSPQGPLDYSTSKTDCETHLSKALDLYSIDSWTYSNRLRCCTTKNGPIWRLPFVLCVRLPLER